MTGMIPICAGARVTGGSPVVSIVGAGVFGGLGAGVGSFMTGIIPICAGARVGSPAESIVGAGVFMGAVGPLVTGIIPNCAKVHGTAANNTNTTLEL